MLAATGIGFRGAYGAAAALLSLLVMWPFVAAAAGLRERGDADRRLGLKRAAGWFLLANLVGLLAGAAGSYVDWAWTTALPFTDDALFHLRFEAWAVVLDLAPFLVVSVVAETLALWAMNLRPPPPEQFRRRSLALLAGGKNLLAYLVVGLAVWTELPATLGGYERTVGADHVRAALADRGGRLWYVAPHAAAVRSVRLDGTDERIEWPGPAPDDFLSLWIIPGQRRLVFVAAERLTLVDLRTGQRTDHPAATPAAGGFARPPATAEELARALGLSADRILPRDLFRPAWIGREDHILSDRAAGEIDELDRRDREEWLRRFGQARPPPSVPSRRAWAAQQELHAVEHGRWIIANYGYQLLVLDPDAGWVGPLGVRARAFAVVPGDDG